MYRYSHYKDKTVARLSYLYNVNPYTGKTSSLFSDTPTPLPWCLQPHHNTSVKMLMFGNVRADLLYCSDVTWALRCLELRATRLFVKIFAQQQRKHYQSSASLAFFGEFICNQWMLDTKIQWCGRMFMSWRHHLLNRYPFVCIFIAI